MALTGVDLVQIISGLISFAAFILFYMLIRMILRANERIKELKIETAALRAEVEHISQKLRSKE